MDETESAAEPVAPRIVGPYQLVARLGAGGMGVVYRARDPVLQRDVALKVLPADRLDSATARARMLREARAQASLAHPNIGTVYQAGEDARQVWIAMELLPGPTLAALGRATRPEEVVQWANGIARALSFAHRSGLVHRDLKPSNVMLDHVGGVKLLDFGLVKVLDATDGSDPTPLTFETGLGAVVGTPRYMSPEQARGETVGPPTDIFSLGLLIYELLSGASPFDGATPGDRLAALIRDKPRALGDDFDPALATLVADCLVQDPQSRPTAAVIVERLSDIRIVDRAPRREATRTRWPWIVGASVAVLGSATAIAMCLSSNETSSVTPEPPTPAIPERVVVDFQPTTFFFVTFDPAGNLYFMTGSPMSRVWRAHRGEAPEPVAGIGPVKSGGVHCCYRDMVVVSTGHGVLGIDPVTEKVSAIPELPELRAISADGQWTAQWTETCPNGADGAIIRKRQTAPRVICAAKRGAPLSALRFSPSGDRLAYFRDGDQVDVMTVNLRSAKLEPRVVLTVPVAQTGASPEGLVWKGNDHLLVFVPGLKQSENALVEIELDASDNVRGRVQHPLAKDVAEPVASRHDEVAFVDHRFERSVLLADLSVGKDSALVPMPSSPDLVSWAGWTSDGRLAISKYNKLTRSSELALQSPGGGATPVLPEDPGHFALAMAVTSSGGVDQIIFTRKAGDHISLWRVRLDGSEAFKLRDDVSPNMIVRCVPSRCLSVTPFDASPIRELDVVTGEERDLIPVQQGTVPGLSPDGRLVAVLDGDAVAIHDLVTKRVERRVVPGGSNMQSVVFTRELDLVITENTFAGGRGVVRLDRHGVVDVLSRDNLYYLQPMMDHIRNRVAVGRTGFLESLRLAPMP